MSAISSFDQLVSTELSFLPPEAVRSVLDYAAAPALRARATQQSEYQRRNAHNPLRTRPLFVVSMNSTEERKKVVAVLNEWVVESDAKNDICTSELKQKTVQNKRICCLGI